MRSSSSVLTRLGAALLVSVLAGLLLGGLVFPLFGGLGLAAKAGADDFLELPAGLVEEQPPQLSRILDAKGGLIATLAFQNRQDVTLKDVPLHVQNALIAIEDSRFREHNGVDVKGTVRAALHNSTGGGTQGGSTLTQQYVKNALLASARNSAGQKAATEQSLQRKLREARYALAVEKRLSKDEILIRYLNIAYFGNGAYGIGAAAQYYFGKPVTALTVAQGAMLAGMVQNPTRFDPTDKDRAREVLTRRNTVLRRMTELGYLSEKARAQGSARPLGLDLHPVRLGCDGKYVGAAGFYCAYVRHELEDTDVGKVLGNNLGERQSRLLGGGLTIRTSLDRKDLKAAQEAVEDRVPHDDPSKGRAAVDMVEPGTGLIKALAVNQAYGVKEGQTKIAYPTGGSYGFQPGSTFKAFVLAVAVQQGIPLSTVFDSPAKYTSPIFTDIDPKTGVKGPYTMRNAGDSESGVFDMRTATADSVNTYFLQLMEKTGVGPVADLAESLGVHWVRNTEGRLDAPLTRTGSLVLGSNEVSPLAMAGAYATFAAHGTYCRPQAVVSITDSRGKALAVPKPPCTSAMAPAVADTVTDLLQGVVTGGTPGRTGKDAYFGRPVAGKTGTTDDSKAAWFVGYTPQLTSAVWVGLPDPKTGAPRSMKNVVIGGRYFDQVYGGTVPAAIFRETMGAALDGQPVQDFTAAPAGAASVGPTGTVPDLRGLSPSAAGDALSAAGFVPTRGGSVSVSYVPSGTIAYSVPGRGQSATQGQTVSYYVNGG